MRSTSRVRPRPRLRRLVPLLWAPFALAACSESDPGMAPEPPSNDPPLIRLFVASDEEVTHGDWTAIQWKIDGATSAAITPDIGLLRNLEAGSKSIRPFHDVTYTLTATNSHGTVTAQATVTVIYRSGVYVDPLNGDDANTGSTPAEPVATLGEAMARTQGGGVLWVAAGDYDAALVIDGSARKIFGGLNPATFLQEDGYETWIRPLSGTPLTVHASAQTSLVDHVFFDARWGGEYGVNVEDAPVVLQDCLVDGSWTASGTALRAAGAAALTVNRCRIRGGGDLPGSPNRNESRGILVDGSSTLALRHSFVSGGLARLRASGVDVNTDGSATLGLSTISAGLVSSASSEDAAAVRIRRGRPAIGGNILFTRGYGKRPGVIEEAADADPSWFHANLLLGVSQPAYDNHAGDGIDAADEGNLNSYQVIIGEGGVGRVFENRLAAIAPTEVFLDAGRTDYHLLNPLRSGGSNPAVDSMPRVFDGTLYGLEAHPVDIDGESRPNTYSEYDRGADEL